MTVAPGTLERLQARLASDLGTVNLGICGDASHVATGGYHIGAKTLRANGMSGDYSLRYDLDKRATDDFACAVDIGGPANLQMTLGNRMVKALQTQDPRVYGKVRAINAPWGGVTIDRRYDLEDPNYKLDDNIQDNSDRGHIHLEVYRTLVLNGAVIDGIFDVFAGKPLTHPPTDPRWSDTVTEDELRTVVREETAQALRASLLGGDHGYWTAATFDKFVKAEGNGVIPRLNKLEAGK